jgi:hypothetical protein
MRVPVYLKQEQARCGTITEHELAARSGTIAVSAIRVRGALHRARAGEQQATHHGPRFDSIPPPKWDAEQQSMSLPLAMRYFPVIAVTERGPPLRCAAQHAPFADENLSFFSPLSARDRGVPSSPPAPKSCKACLCACVCTAQPAPPLFCQKEEDSVPCHAIASAS